MLLTIEAFHTRAVWEHENRYGGSGDSRNRIHAGAGTLDDVLTYTLLGIVISGGDTKGECLNWHTKACTLARELNTNREVDDDDVCTAWEDQKSLPDTIALDNLLAIEEAKEERRRTWWLLFIMDRHLALCFNAPLNILDAECSIYQPLDDATWRDLDIWLSCNSLPPPRTRGPSTIVTGVGLFEYFLPLMAILGDIIDIHHLNSHPRFGPLGNVAAVEQVEQTLKSYEASLKTFEDSVMVEMQNMGQYLTCSSPRTIFDACRDLRPWSVEQAIQKSVIGYSNYLLHVFYILLHSSWDPVRMLDDPNQWVTPNGFMECATHAISAASAVSEILKFDPELSFMPYLFGIYLLHGSFVLLIFADQMEMASNDTVSQAFETIIQAHEVCVTTLSTEYQVSRVALDGYSVGRTMG